jgi:GTP pyrophosphokinase
LQEEEFKAAKMGKELLERRLNNWKLEIDDSDITYLVKKYKYKTINEFYSALGTESLDVTEIKNYILEEKDSQKSEYVQREVVHKQSSDSDYLIIGDNRGLKGLDYKMAKCCNPVFGDDVFGFVTINDGVKIHRMSCPNAERLLTNYPHRVQKVKWKESNNVSSFQTTLKIVVDDESGINSVLSTITQFKASVRSFNTSERMRERNFELVATIFVSTTLELDKIIASVRKLRDVKQVTRQ